ncbi:hypothetical protein NBRC116598_21370 [Pseudophaeobacter arcticus]|uniref:Uncharacterized protein n=1 Tax=Pseudophaeobacter arcticus TaxID=385492 RepID=A0ABQ0ALE2_9RHOB
MEQRLTVKFDMPNCTLFGILAGVDTCKCGHCIVLQFPVSNWAGGVETNLPASPVSAPEGSELGGMGAWNSEVVLAEADLEALI